MNLDPKSVAEREIRLKCLELAVAQTVGLQPVTEVAQNFYDFLTKKPAEDRLFNGKTWLQHSIDVTNEVFQNAEAASLRSHARSRSSKKAKVPRAPSPRRR